MRENETRRGIMLLILHPIPSACWTPKLWHYKTNFSYRCSDMMQERHLLAYWTDMVHIPVGYCSHSLPNSCKHFSECILLLFCWPILGNSQGIMPSCRENCVERTCDGPYGHFRRGWPQFNVMLRYHGGGASHEVQRHTRGHTDR